MTEPTHKKRKLSLEEDKLTSSEESEYNAFRTRQLLAEEFDLEIALRQRLAATIESRVTWALVLQETLSNDITSGSTPGDFENAAVEAIDAIETPCNVLFDRDPTPPQVIHDLLERGSRASVTSESRPQLKPRIRKSRPSRARPRPQATKLLFIRNAAVTPPTVAKMVCPDCDKSDFTNLQGLLNHARLRHRREYGSHEECMQICAVIVDDQEGEAEWVVKHGIEIGGVSLPSVRRLFEIAVGDDRGFVDGFRVGAEENDEDAEVISSTYLSKTLGHHKDTPALAPFLGRPPKRRCINVHPDNEDVDIQDLGPSGRKAWRMSFSHRNTARPELDIAMEAPSMPDARTKAGSGVQLASISNNTTSTRFHIIARVVVSDRSLWIPPERRAQAFSNHTHRWIVGVDSPSYSLHISAFLQKMTVTCITDPPPSTLSTPLTIEEYPFVISSTTDIPFLAKVTLTWVGFQNVPMEVEHWVDLDPFHTSIVNPVLGVEQLLDVELDRHTELLPIRRNDPISRKRRGEDHTKGGEDIAIGQNELDDPYYVTKLKTLLPRFPMTMKDVKGRMSVHHLQYKVISTPAQLSGLLPGRRKAIEWGRALALRDAYQAMIESVPRGEGEAPIPLTTGDVFRWLEDEGLFVRPMANTIVKIPAQEVKAAKSGSAPTKPLGGWCPVCGLNHQPTVSPPTMKVEAAFGTDAGCNIVHDLTNWHSMTIVDVRNPLALPSSSNDHHSNPHLFSSGAFASTLSTSTQSLPISPLIYSPRHLLAVTHPDLTIAIRDIVQPLGLPCFRRLSPEGSLAPLSKCRGTKSQIEVQMAPYALMASFAKTFVHLLVRSGLDTANLDMSMATAKAKAEGRNARKAKPPRSRLLTPSHVIRGLTTSSVQRGRPLAATSLFLARFGLGVSTSHLATVTAPNSATDITSSIEVAVKTEV